MSLGAAARSWLSARDAVVAMTATHPTRSTATTPATTEMVEARCRRSAARRVLKMRVDLVMAGQADAFCFAPLNKSALRQGGMTQEDELRWFAEHMHYAGVCGELNVLKNLWTARVTSHVPLSEVSSLLNPEKVADAIRMIQICTRFPTVHGAPVHFGEPAAIGIQQIDRPDYGDAVSIKPGEVPVFTACGVTPQAAIMQAKPDFCITHSPGCMLVTDIPNSKLAIL